MCVFYKILFYFICGGCACVNRHKHMSGRMCVGNYIIFRIDVQYTLCVSAHSQGALDN